MTPISRCARYSGFLRRQEFEVETGGALSPAETILLNNTPGLSLRDWENNRKRLPLEDSPWLNPATILP